MVTIRKYTPAFVYGAEDIMATVSSKESLLEIPFVKSWMSHDTFREFRVSNEALVVFLEENNGEWLWFVVGIFQCGTEKEAGRWFGKADYSKYIRNKNGKFIRKENNNGK